MKVLECMTAMKALGEETRLRTVAQLLHHPDGQSVNDLADALAVSQYNISKHLRILRHAGLVESRKDAQQRIYTLAQEVRERLKRDSRVLDLGCCQFHFDNPGL